MKFARIGEAGHERPHIVTDAGLIDISDLVPDFTSEVLQTGLARFADVSAEPVPVTGVRFGPPIPRPHQILCIGLNYSDHAAETGQEVPAEPILFTKSPNSLTGPDDVVMRPRGAVSLDWEVELGIVIGRRAAFLDNEDQAREAIAGYVVVNDVSERDFQTKRGGQWSKGKSAPTFNPCGPYLVTPDEVGDPLNLEMHLEVNGQVRQSGSTRTMIFSPSYIVYYLSQFMALEPGDLINTGTPPGVGLGMKPPQYLQPGDVVTLGIEKLGEQRQEVIEFDPGRLDRILG